MASDATNTSGNVSDFIRDIIQEDLLKVRHGRIVTRFPPEPNGFIHLGHAKSICLNFGIAGEHQGTCHLRFDDTNPAREDTKYVNSIQEDVRWLGFDWQASPFFTSDYFERLHVYAQTLIQKGKAFVCDLSAEDFMRTRGTPTHPGEASPFRDRSVADNLELFERMRAGAFEDGSKTLRARIDMASPNIHMRDPALYRIRRLHHHRTGDTWPIYPMYDFAHCLSDAIEGITHSLCTLEFEVHRPLYEWILEHALGEEARPRQIEFARLNLGYTILSKRKLLQLVEEKHVSGWDDPRMPTVSGLRRRGVTPESVRQFCKRIGITKYDGITDIAVFEHSIREDLNKRAMRVLGVLHPLKVVIENLPEDHIEKLDAVNNPEDPESGTRQLPFSREIYIDRNDFMEEAPKKFFRLKPQGEVRLRYAYILKCEEVIKDDNGKIVELRASIDPDSKRGGATAGRKVKGTIHWVSKAHAVDAEIRLYDRLFTAEQPDSGKGGSDFRNFLNPDSLQVIKGCKLESSLAHAVSSKSYQFERVGYFCLDSFDSDKENLVFNRTIALKDAWAKMKR
ncbi:MAG: glutamine--tRNA ligase/YqeY domain fusion protein [Verrucomicrobiota bacterium]|nr:glutamine--tRNA ligase/YqeY domain fusion protein [Verrucomicrobiota bacterium]